MNASPLVASKLELHYFFDDDTHTIDASVRNKCEAEILKIVKEIAIQLGSDITVETEAYLEGGLIDRWKALDAKSISAAALLVAIIGVVLSRYPVSTANPELERLNIEIARHQLAKLKAEEAKEKEKEEESQVTESTPDEETPTIPRLDDEASLKQEVDALKLADVLNGLDTNIKVTRFKSNFYTHLNNYKKVIQISTTPLSDENEPVEQPKTILREQFSEFIIESDELDPESIEEATIEIVSPVLRKGKYKWKGLYLGENIDFYMKDNEFKELIYGKKISFQTGVCIECNLEINKRIDDLGNIQITNYSVIAVLKYTEGTAQIETENGRKIRNQKNKDRDQTTMDFSGED
jgi:hypothetical protein